MVTGGEPNAVTIIELYMRIAIVQGVGFINSSIMPAIIVGIFEY